MSALNPLGLAHGEGTKPGILIRRSDASLPFKDSDKDLLEARLDTKIGEGKVKKVELSPKKMKAYVELNDVEDIATALSCGVSLGKRDPPLIMEHFDLAQVWYPYLTVRGLEFEGIEANDIEDAIQTQFENMPVCGAKIESIEINGSEAKIFFIQPQAALKFPPTFDWLGLTLTLEVEYSTHAELKTMVLAVNGLPKLSAKMCKTALVNYFLKHSGFKAVECHIIESAAYLSFEDTFAVRKILSNPPTADFYCGTILKLSAVPAPVSQMLPTKETDLTEDPSTSSALESRMMSSTNSVELRHLKELETVSPNSCIMDSQTEFRLMSPNSAVDFMPLQEGFQVSMGGADQAIHHLEPDKSMLQCSHNSSTSSELSDSNLSGTLKEGFQSPNALSADSVHSRTHLESETSPGKLDDSTSSKKVTTKVLIATISSNISAFNVECYLARLMLTECSVKQYGQLLMATFFQPIDFQELKTSSSTKPLEKAQLSFYSLESTSTILITTDVESLLNQHLLKLHFERFVRGSVQEVKILQPDKALVYFSDPQSVERVMENSECHEISGCRINLTEYYDFMDVDNGKTEEDTDDGFITPPSQEAELPLALAVHSWKVINIEINDNFWETDCLRLLNSDLGYLNAHATMFSDQSGALQLKIDPVAGSETMADWDQDVKKAVDNFRKNFKKVTQILPDYGSTDLIKYAESASESHKVKVQVAGNVMTLTGDADLVDHVVERVNEMINQLLEIKSEHRSFTRRHIKYLEMFCTHQLKNTRIPVENIIFNCEQETIIVQANQESRELFWEVVNAEIEKIKEKSILLEFEAFTLLATEQGAKRIEDIIGMQAVYDLVSDPPHYMLYLLSPSFTSKDKLKTTKISLQKLINFREVKVVEKFRFCKDVKWKELVDKLESDVFVKITVDDINKSVKATGEAVVIDSVIQLIQAHLSEEASIKEHILIDGPKWMVISQNYWGDLEAIKKHHEGQNVEIKLPEPGITALHTSAMIIVKGDPPMVDKIKTKIEALQKRVYEKEETLSNIPAVLVMINTIEHTIRALESNFKASIEVNMKENESVNLASVVPSKLCIATCPNGVRISVYSGDFTKHRVDAVINFIPPAPTYQEDNLKLLLAAGGVSFKQDFRKKISQFLHDSPGEIFTSDSGELQCSKLCHCMIPPWDGKVTRYLETCLGKTLHIIKRSTTVLFTSICSSPLNYPTEVFADNILSLLSTNSDISSDLTVAVYASEVAKFEEQFQLRNCHLSSKACASTGAKIKSIHNPISSYITLTKGDLFTAQADVYINSTNSTLDLKTGTLSRLFLKVCGEELQKECSTHAPLKPEVVAVTKVKNVKANFVYHVALPDYKQEFHHATRTLRRTVQAILRTARDEGHQSLAIPSLGVGNLHYPAEVSAKILFEEIISFHERNPKYNISFNIVVFDHNTHLEFSKVYAQKMNSAPMMKKSSEKKSKCLGKGQGESTQLSIINADISEESSEIIVNTTSEDMKLSNSAVAKALLKKAGPMLQTACDQLVQSGLRLDHGQIAVTKSFGSLQCKKIIHAHLPLRSEAKNANLDFPSIIKMIVNQCLEKAENLNMRSISFPAFGFGQGGYSVHEVAEPMLTAFRDFGRQGPKSVEVVRVVIFDYDLHKQFFEFFAKFFQIDLSVPEKIINSLLSKSNRAVELRDNHAVTPLDYPEQQEVDTNSLLCFRIFANSNKKCDEIAKELRETIKKQCLNDKIEKPVIVNLIDADIGDIRAIGISQQVQVNVLAEIGKIEIYGEKSQVKEAIIQILAVISEIEKSENDLKLYKWLSEEDNGFVPYSNSDSFKLERARAHKLPAIDMVIDDIEVIIDLTKMEERSKKSGIVRKVRRVALKLPDTWAPQPTDASGKEESMHMFDVPEGTLEYKEVFDIFHKSTHPSNVTITSIKRVQNPIEYQKHMAILEAIVNKHQKKKIDVRKLFHGCAETSIEPIAVQGFNRNFAATANAAVYGKGVYFALNSNYSAQTRYSVPNKDGHQSMFVCQVIVGEYTVGKQGMNTAPPMEEGSKEVYDTLVDSKDNPTIFVALTDAQAYPEYLLTFKAEKK